MVKSRLVEAGLQTGVEIPDDAIMQSEDFQTLDHQEIFGGIDRDKSCCGQSNCG